MNRRTALKLGGALAVSALARPAIASDSPIVLKFPHDVPVTQIKGMAANRIKKLVAERLKGKVKIQVYPNGQLYPNERDALEALQQGAVQLVMPTFAKWTPVMPSFAIFELPFVITSAQMMKDAMKSPDIGGRLFGEKLNAKGLQGLGLAPDGFREMDMRRRPIRKLEDFEGQKIRIQDSTTFTAFMKYAKAVPVPISFSETYSALSAGIVDGWEGPFGGIAASRLEEVAPYISVTDHVFNAYLLGTNKKFWDGLPPDIRVELQKIVDDVFEWQWGYSTKLQVDARKKLADHGAKINDIDPAEKARMVKYFRGMHAEFKDVVGQDMLEAMYKLADADTKS
jgi:C4-dicarboxylate-binding protein DctP